MRFSGKYYSAAGNAADQAVKVGGGFIGFVSAIGTGTVTIKDGNAGAQVCQMTVPFTLFLGIQTQTGITVNAPATATSVSLGYD